MHALARCALLGNDSLKSAVNGITSRNTEIAGGVAALLLRQPASPD